MHNGKQRSDLDAVQLKYLGTCRSLNLPDRRYKQLNRPNEGQESEVNANLSWRDELQVPNKYVANRHKFLEMLARFENS